MKAELYLVSYLSRGCGVALQASHTEVPIATNFQSKFVFQFLIYASTVLSLKWQLLSPTYPENGLYKLGWNGGAAVANKCDIVRSNKEVVPLWPYSSDWLPLKMRTQALR